MNSMGSRLALCAAAVVLGVVGVVVCSEQAEKRLGPSAPHDAIVEAQTPKEVPVERPEQKKSPHDLSDVFAPSKALPTTEALTKQTDQGQFRGFDLYKDPVGAMKPGMTFDEIYTTLVAAKPKVKETQQKLLESRYNLEPKLDPVAKMSRGKSLVVGPTVRLPEGMSWEELAALGPEEIQKKDIFPYKALPHPVQGGGLGGQVFPPMQIKMFPRLERYDVEFDLPEAFLPEFPSDVSPEPPRAGRRFPGRSGFDQ
jgi:hypothetical protein